MDSDSQQNEAPVANEPSTSTVAQTSRVPGGAYLFLVLVSSITFALDWASKSWALRTLEKPLAAGLEGTSTPVQLTSWLGFVLARNRGGAWGILQTTDESVRRPFFLLISVLAIGFIVYLFRKLHPEQYALRWGLPLVLGGAVGNLFDRVRYAWVVDFIDYRAGWVESLNRLIAHLAPNHVVTDHWPTFNVADVAICAGVILMAIDMFTPRRVAAVQPAEASSSVNSSLPPSAPAEP